jgi:RNA polymerase sigma-70 factor (ECF subfamily)
MTAGVAALRRPGYRTEAMLLAALLGIVGRAESDEPLLRLVAAGDSRALRSLYDRHAPAALALAFRILRAKSEAEEVVQEAFVEVWRRAAAFDPRRGTASSFVLNVCRSRALDRLRARGSAERAAAASAREEPEPAPLPIESAVQRQDRERVRQALAALPAEQRAAIELAYFAGLTQREIAERLGEPLGTVKTRVRLALEKLSAILDDEKRALP